VHVHWLAHFIWNGKEWDSDRNIIFRWSFIDYFFLGFQVVITGNVFLVLPMIKKEKYTSIWPSPRALYYSNKMYNMQQIYEANRLLPTLFVTCRTLSHCLIYAFDTPLFNNGKVRESIFSEVRRRGPENFPLHTFKITWPFECLSTANIIFGGKAVPRRWKDWCSLIGK
jgi:hypothetical protein